MPPPDDTRSELERLADELAEHAAALRRQCEELGELLAGQVAEEEDAIPFTQESDALGPMRSIAIEMALAGRTREEVDSHIREVYGVDADPDVLDSVFERRAG